MHFPERMKGRIPFSFYQDTLLIREKVSMSLLLPKMKLLDEFNPPSQEKG